MTTTEEWVEKLAEIEMYLRLGYGNAEEYLLPLLREAQKEAAIASLEEAADACEDDLEGTDGGYTDGLYHAVYALRERAQQLKGNNDE